MLIKNLFKSRKRRNYNVRRGVVDDRKHLGNQYRDNILKNSLSPYIYRNGHMNDFIVFMQQILGDLVDSVTYLKAYKSYTIKKDDTKIR